MRAMEVIGAGFGRTGTLSLKQTLEDLGFARPITWLNPPLRTRTDGEQVLA